MKRLIQALLIIAVVIYYAVLYVNNVRNSFTSQNKVVTKQYDIKVENKVKPVVEKKEDIPKNNNIDNVNFEKQVAANRSVLNEKFPGNYIDRTLKSGQLVRWNPSTFPLYVYVEHNSDLPEYYDKTVKRAFAQWQKAGDGFITFKFTDIEDYSDIRCYFPNNYRSENDGQRMIAGVTKFEYNKDKLKYAQINFASYDMNNKFRTESALYSTALHEIGHALGISGHSVNKEDVMYPVTQHTESKISKNDISTLKLIYSIVPDIINQNYSEQEKNTYITTDDVLGTYDTRLDIELEATKADINADENSYYAGKYFNMANIYYKKQDYNNAIKNYEKGLTMTSDPKDIEAVNMNLAICYNELQNYEKALKHVKISNDINRTLEKSIFMANMYYRLGDSQKAKNIAKNVIAQDHNNYNSYIVLYNIYKDENNDEEIYKLYEKGMKYFPDNPPIRMNKR